MRTSSAKRLLAHAASEENRLRRHLFVAAAVREVLPSEPIVVGGTAEEFWTVDEYHETDLDLCVPFGPASEERLLEIGFRREGRHWVIGDVAMEIPESEFDGDFARTHLEHVGEGAARIIGLDGLYLDRLKQATMRENVEGIDFQSALAVAAAGYATIDWPYVRKRVASEAEYLRQPMTRINARIRRRIRRELG